MASTPNITETVNAYRQPIAVREHVERPSPTHQLKAAPEKSYLATAVESISPWTTSRGSTPNPPEFMLSTGAPGSNAQPRCDHTIRHQHGLSSRLYPDDCPPLNSRWFYAVDSPKRKPKLLNETTSDPKTLPAPKKFVTFSSHDSNAIEHAYQNLIEEQESEGENKQSGDLQDVPSAAAYDRENTSINEAGSIEHAGGRVKVPVNEDFLFDVDIETRELAPVYWLGPIYEVRRGSWFYQDGSLLKPCEEKLALQLEEGYLKVKPFRYPKQPNNSSSRPVSMKPPSDDPASLAEAKSLKSLAAESNESTPRPSIDNARAINQQALDDTYIYSKDMATPGTHQPQTYRLFGTHMNSVVTYQDDTVAWLSSDGIISRVSSTVYQRFAGGGYLGGVKCVRGFKDSGKITDVKLERHVTPKSFLEEGIGNSAIHVDERQQQLLKRRSAPPGTLTSTDTSTVKERESGPDEKSKQPQTRDTVMKREIMVADALEAEGRDEAARQRDEQEIQNDYPGQDGEAQSREIEHLILVTHGIGQRLGMRTESVNFVHDVNIFRQTLKSVYSDSADLQALNSEIDKLPKNCRIQVLPVCWRHLLDFPRQRSRNTRKEHDLGDNVGEDEEYPSLEDITVEGVPFVRSLITDLALDILLYQSAYREDISGIVLRECNRIYKLFVKRNPTFHGKVSLVGHSLGSAILFDALCRQKEDIAVKANSPHKYHQTQPIEKTHNKIDEKDLGFAFDVEDFYCLGSPIGLFQILKGRSIAARHHPDALPAESPMDPDFIDDPFLAAGTSGSYSGDQRISSVTGLPVTISSPKCSQVYNIFHPSDPIAYRLEPLIAPAMSSLKPQSLPYTKKGMFGASASQGLTGIGAKVGQSMSGFWSSLSGGITSSILNRSLGLSGEEIASMSATQTPTTRGSISNVSGGAVSDEVPALARQDPNENQRQLAENTMAANIDGNTAPTLIDDDIETLYAGFQKRRRSRQEGREHGNRGETEAEEQSKKLKREELKVRGLNKNGRVDFSIQESVLDFNPMNTIASHLAYWSDEDVAHFMMSQLLSRHLGYRRYGGPMADNSRHFKN